MSLPSREFLHEITPATRLILWISNDPLSLKTPGIKECDYLSDGLINNFIKAQPNSTIAQNTFHTHSFGNKLFIAFYQYSKTTLADIDDVLGLISDKTENSDQKLKIVLVQSQDTNKDLLAELIRRYRQFEIINYSF